MASTTDPLLATWGHSLKTLRQDAGLSQEQLAARLTPAVNQSTVARWETGRREPRRTYRAQLAALLGIDHPAVA